MLELRLFKDGDYQVIMNNTVAKEGFWNSDTKDETVKFFRDMAEDINKAFVITEY